MASQSVSSPISQLLHSNATPPPPHSPRNGLFLVDFIGLHCKSKRTRRKLGASSFSSPLSRAVPQFVAKRASSVRAVLDLERTADFASQPKVADLKDILSERGACGVGFIANLDNIASHQIVEDALTALGCMEHRGGCGADNDSGDGSGVMTSIPWDLFDNWANSQGIATFDKLHTGVGMVFLPKDDELVKEAKKGISSNVQELSGI